MASWTPEDMPSLQGKVAVVTGASVGIGFQIVRQLAQHGAKVFATTRSEKSVQKAQEALRSSYPDISPGAVEWLQLDLADLKSVTEAADAVKQQSDRLDILVSNAATITTSQEVVAGRWEKNLAVNVIGSFLFFNRLMPLLESTSNKPGSDVRVVTIASTAPHAFLPNNFQFHFDSPSGLISPVPSYPWAWRFFARFLFASDMILYSVSKAGAQIYASKLQQAFDKRGSSILSLVVHPGEVATEGVAEANNALMRAMARMAFISSEQGSASPLFAATAARVRQDPNQYKQALLMPVGKVSSLHPVVNDEKQAQGLLDVITKELQDHLAAEGLAPLQQW